MVTITSLSTILIFVMNSILMFKFCSDKKYNFILYTILYLLTQFIIIPFLINSTQKIFNINIPVNLWDVIITVIQIFSFLLTIIVAYDTRK
jgi:hypothetical protein